MQRPAGWARLLSLLLAGLALVWLVTVGVVFSADAEPRSQLADRDEQAWAYDYEAYLAASQRLAGGGSLYQPETLEGPYRPGPYGLYMYSPTLGVGLLPLSGMASGDSALVWFALHVLALLGACAVMPVRPEIRLLAFALAAFSFAVVRDLALGNVSVLLLLPLAMTWRWLDRPIGQAALAVAVSVRPTLGIVLVWQLLRGRWRAVAWTVAAGLVLVVLTLPLVGLGSYLDYLAVLRNMRDVTGVRFNYDLGSVALEWSGDGGIATLALFSSYAIAIVAVLASLRRDREVGYMVTLGGSLLLSPLLWDHYLAMLVLPAAFLAQRGRSWAILLPLATWLPPLFEAWVILYPLLAIIATLVPFLARPRPHAAESSPSATAQAWA